MNPNNAKFRTALLLAVILSMVPLTARGAFFEYVDETGRRIFVDDRDKIPMQYRKAATVYAEPKDQLSDTERQRMEAVEAEKKRKARQDYLQHIEQIKRRQAAEAARRARERREIRQRELETPIIVDNNQILVPVTVAHNGIEVDTHLLLDTGASMIALHQSVARELKIDSVMRARAQVVGGATIRAGFLRLSYVRVGPMKVNNPVAGIIDHTGPPVAYGGFLGMNILKEVSFRIDFDRKVIRWLPGPAGG